MNMFGLDFNQACELCGIDSTTAASVAGDRQAADQGQIILFNFERTQLSLCRYLFYLFCTNNILVLNPENRSVYTPDYHDLIPFHRTEGFRQSDRTIYDPELGRLTTELMSNGIRLIVPTSGSTGVPRLICFDGTRIQQAAVAISDSLDLASSDTALGYLPLSYVYGLSVLHSHLAAGSRFRYLQEGEKMIGFLSNESISHHYMVPSILNSLSKYAESIDFSGRMVAQAGGAMDFSASCFWHKLLRGRGVEFVKMYGQTECGPRVSCLRTVGLLENDGVLGTVGSPILGVKVSLAARDREVFVDSPFLAKGSISGKDFAYSAFGKTLGTGDIGSWYAPDILSISGRKARFAKVQGIRVGLDELELNAERIFGCNCVVISHDDLLFLVTDEKVSSELLKSLARHHGLPARYFRFAPAGLYKLNANSKKDYQSISTELKKWI